MRRHKSGLSTLTRGAIRFTVESRANHVGVEGACILSVRIVDHSSRHATIFSSKPFAYRTGREVSLAPQPAFPKQNEIGKTLFFTERTPALREGVRIRRHGESRMHLTPPVANCFGTHAALRIAVVQHIAVAAQLSALLVHRVRAIWVIHSSLGCRVMPAKFTGLQMQ